MPKRYRKSTSGRRTRRPTYRKRMPRRRPSSAMALSVKRMPSLFPDAALVTFRYSVLEVQALTKDLLTHFTYRLNSLYDPEFKLGGGQPMGFDQWAALYNRYVVYGGKITLEFMSESTLPFEVFVGPDNDSTAPTTSNQFAELPLYKNKVVNSAWAPATKISNTCMVKVLEGFPIGSEQDYGAAIAANPNIQKFWQVALIQGSVAAGFTVNMRVTIEYYSKMYQRKTTLPRS